MNRQERIVRFQSNICESCRICEGYENDDFDPEFCFDKFEEDGAVFVEDVYPRLLLVGANLGSQGLKEKDLTYAFCDTGVCFVGDTEIARHCTKTNKCLKGLLSQATQMSKKKHKRRAARIYSKKQFSNFICGQCAICPAHTEPEFCFDELYKHNPKDFMEKIYPKLLSLKKDFRARATHLSAIDVKEFKKNFCYSGLCFPDKKDCDECYASSDCYDTFVDSTCGLHVVAKIKKTTQGKKKNSYVPVPYATFFSSSKKGFQEEIQRILYGNKNKKQNTDKEMPGSLVAEIHSGPADGESEVPGSAEAGA